MIPNQWYALLESREVKRRRPLAVRRLGERLIFWRDAAGTLACLRDTCPHRGAQLSLGKLTAHTIACPFHGFEFAADGRGRLVPALGRNAEVPAHLRATTYPAVEANGFVWVWWGRAPTGSELPPVPWFDDLPADLPYQTFRDPWSTHYSRAIENQLDVVHLPFVHHSTIGRGGRTLVHGPAVELAADRLTVWMHNTPDDGSAPLPAEAVDRELSPVTLQLLFPNVWQNRLSEGVRVVAAFAPVDDEQTLIYLRFYQRAIGWPLIGWLIGWLSNRFNRVILHQDRRVVQTQEPKRSDLEIGERLIPGDRPIVAYRRRRRELIDAAS